MLMVGFGWVWGGGGARARVFGRGCLFLNQSYSQTSGGRYCDLKFRNVQFRILISVINIPVYKAGKGK